MNKQNIEIWERIREVDDDEIRNFIISEKNRLGDILQGFTITWNPTETEYHLELYSEGSQTLIKDHPWPWGKGFIIGRTPQQIKGCDTLEQIQQAGRAFYFSWRKEIKNLKRNLGS